MPLLYQFLHQDRPSLSPVLYLLSDDPVALFQAVVHTVNIVRMDRAHQVAEAQRAQVRLGGLHQAVLELVAPVLGKDRGGVHVGDPEVASNKTVSKQY